jgi:hypothetical protein
MKAQGKLPASPPELKVCDRPQNGLVFPLLKQVGANDNNRQRLRIWDENDIRKAD